MKINRVIFSVFLLACILLSSSAMAVTRPYNISTFSDERITDFESDIVVNKDSSMVVKESIKVISTGDKIKRGIYRDFPTVYRDNYNNKYNVSFEVVEVLRDGKAEPYRIELISNGKRIRIGSSNTYVDEGEHVYTIIYNTGRQLGFFETHDELYWNVTGNEWNFKIDKASARITLPEGVSKKDIKLEAYTGSRQSREKKYTGYVDTNNRAYFSTTQPLMEKQGLTIVVGWPKGFVSEPTAEQKFMYFIRDNMKYAVAIISVLGILGYYILMWIFVGRDPRKGTIIPLYEPPIGLSPASVRFIYNMKFDKKTLTAAILSMASKGYLTIGKDTDFDKYELTKTDSIANLSSEESGISEALFGSSGKKIKLSNLVYSKVQKALLLAEKELKKNYELKYFLTNNKYFVIGCVFSVIALVISVISSLFFANEVEDIIKLIFSTVWLSIWSIGVAALLSQAVKAWREVATKKKSGEKMVSIGSAVFSTLFSIPFVIGEVVGLTMLLVSGGLAFGLSMILLIIINTCFYYLLKAPTMQGRQIMDQIEGFKLFLGVAEKDRLNFMFPVSKTPELFERFLPYALALDVEQEWAEQFADVFANMSDGSTTYTPSWYYSDLGTHGITDFTSSISSSFTDAISSSSSPPPSSSSGFSGGGGGFSGGGGGGFSGGGGGGGGGGGW